MFLKILAMGTKIVCLLSLLILSSCNNKKDINKIKISQHSCKPNPIKLEFFDVIDLESALMNEQLASLYYYQQQQQLNNTIDCYDKLVNEINK